MIAPRMAHEILGPFSAVLRSFATPDTEMMLAARRMPATSEGQETGRGERRRNAENCREGLNCRRLSQPSS
jgi:hypothetical protein